MQCPKCGGPSLFLGTLGFYEHYTCRNCGWQESIRVQIPDTSYGDGDDTDYYYGECSEDSNDEEYDDAAV